MSKRIALILTAHTKLGETGKPTGFWFEELASPYFCFTDAGHGVDIYKASGANLEADPLSLMPEGGRGEVVDRFLADPMAMQKLKSVQPIVESFAEGSYGALLLVGGHGAMWDFPGHEHLGTAIAALHARGAVVASVCHGAAGLIGVVGSDGRPIVENRRVTAFTNEEESIVGLTEVVPFLLETQLRQTGAHVQTAAPFSSHALRDGNLITGQNPQSSAAMARLVLKALSAA
jgi:putative intracellular protease/amidase